jgi:hypothetical protein
MTPKHPKSGKFIAASSAPRHGVAYADRTTQSLSHSVADRSSPPTPSSSGQVSLHSPLHSTAPGQTAHTALLSQGKLPAARSAPTLLKSKKGGC